MTAKQIALATAGVLGALVVAIVAVIVLSGAPPADEPIGHRSPDPSPGVALASPPPGPSADAIPSPASSAAPTPPPSTTPSPVATASAGATPSTSPPASPSAAPSPTAPATGWTRSELDQSRRFRRQLEAALDHGETLMWLGVPSITVDGAGNAHVTWTAENEDWPILSAIHYASNSSGRWSLTELPTPQPAAYDNFDVLAADSAGTVAVTFSRAALSGDDAEWDRPDPAFLVLKSSGAWSGLIEAPPRYGRAVLAVHDGDVHLAYITGRHRSEEWQVWHARYSGAGWTTSHVTDAAEQPTKLVMDVAAEGEVRIAFVAGQRIFQARGPGTGGGFTTIEVAAPPLGLEEWVLLAFDRDGGLHLVSDDQYTRLSSAGWLEPQFIFPRVTWFDACGERGWRGRPEASALSIGPDGTAHVVAAYNDVRWTLRPWHASNRGGTFASVVLGSPEAVYAPTDRLRERLDHFCFDDYAVEPDPGERGVAMTIDALGRPHIVTTKLDYFIGPAD